MKKHTNSKTILISSIFPLMLLALVGVIASNTTVSALEYQTTADVSFTFRPFINVNFSGDLVINNLAPGSYADSNIITVGVSTNAGNGYVMQATAGTNTTNTRLVNTDNSNFYFSSLGTSDTVTSMNSASDNTWGFSYSDDDGTTWISAPGTLGYSGLPLDANTNTDERGKGGKTLLDTDGTTGDQSIQFKIGAKAATTQAAGTYTNIINFYAVANPEPEPEPECSTPVPGITYMQDINSSNKATILSNMTENFQYYLEDNRDNKTYCVAKLADGNIWMTQNLDFDIVNSGADLDSTNTDVPSSWADAGSLNDTHTTNDTAWDSSVTTPASYDPGDLCWDGTIRSDDSGTLANSTVACTSDRHYHIGNYYNWTAAVAMASSGNYVTYGVDVNQSICPAGWMLPRGGSNPSSGSLQYLVEQYGWDSSTYELGNNVKLWEAPLYFSLSGRFGGSSPTNIGNEGNYWLSAVGVSNCAFYSTTDGTAINPNYSYGYRATAMTIRCVAR